MNAEKRRSSLSIVMKNFNFIFLLVLVIYIFVTLFGNNNLVKVFGVEFAIVQSQSMKPKLNIYDFVIITNNTKNLKENDIVVFFDDSKTHKIIHRIVEVENNEKGAFYYTKGDANGTRDAGVRSSADIYAKYATTIPYLGAFITFFTSSLGMSVLLINVVNLLIIMLIWSFEKENIFEK